MNGYKEFIDLLHVFVQRIDHLESKIITIEAQNEVLVNMLFDSDPELVVKYRNDSLKSVLRIVASLGKERRAALFPSIDTLKNS